MHLSAPLQASGEARYTDDIPKQTGELYAGLVSSTHAHAKFTVDWSSSLKVDGVEGYASVEDVPGSNSTGLYNDEMVFADGEVTHFGQIIGMVLARNQMVAQRAAKLVKVSYTDLPSVITIEVSCYSLETERFPHV
jgi:xanthine dehydrogenase/oxidase